MGVDKYCNDLQDTWDFIRHFEEIMEYRIVIRGNCEYVKNQSFYSNGLLTGLGMSVADLVKLDFGSIAENYTYTKTFDEILNITNLQICLEYKPK